MAASASDLGEAGSRFKYFFFSLFNKIC